MKDRWQDRVSEYLDGELTPSESQRFEKHLSGCEECQDILHDLRELTGQAASLPQPEVPERIWDGIAARLADQGFGERAPAPVVELPVARRGLPTQWAIAAAVTLAVLSGVSGWYLRGPQAPVQLSDSDGPAMTMPVGMNRLPADVQEALVNYERSVTELELVLGQLADRMDPMAQETLEGNLSTIDRAIYEARAALIADPESEYLNAHLADSMMRKVRLLRQATRLASNEI